MNGTTDKRKAPTGAGHRPAAAASMDALDKRILQLSHATPVSRLREDFAERELPMLLIRGDEAPASLRGTRPQVFVDAKVHRALCVVVNDEATSISDVVYVGAEALATAYEFPRDPGNRTHEALVNSFALSYLSSRVGPEQAQKSFRFQLRKLQQLRLQGALDLSERQAIALRCWAIGTALDPEERETLLGQVEMTDADTAELVVTLTQAWGSCSPSTGVEASRLVAVSPF